MNKFPKMLYKAGPGFRLQDGNTVSHITVENAEEDAVARDRGWKETPEAALDTSSKKLPPRSAGDGAGEVSPPPKKRGRKKAAK